MAEYRFRDAEAKDSPVIRALVMSVLEEYGLSPDYSGTDTDLDDVAQHYIARGGVFRVLISFEEEIVGCGGLYPLTPDEVELRKMYFLPPRAGVDWGAPCSRS